MFAAVPCCVAKDKDRFYRGRTAGTVLKWRAHQTSETTSGQKAPWPQVPTLPGPRIRATWERA